MLDLQLAAPVEVPEGSAGCFVADSFTAYEAIRGVIIRGGLTASGTRSLHMTVHALGGFAFGADTPS
jgi:hypothetical protein